MYTCIFLLFKYIYLITFEKRDEGGNI